MILSLEQLQNAISTLTQLGQTRKLTEKRKILLSQIDNQILQQIFTWAENPRITFGVKKFTISDESISVISTHQFDKMTTLLNMLIKRSLTGNEARRVITQTSSTFCKDMQDLLSKILNRNLKCNVGTTLILEVWPNLFPHFGCQLAESVKAIEDIPLPCYASPKLDGTRNIGGIDNGILKHWTRTGDSNHNIEYIKSELGPLIDKFGLTFDGELLSTNWNDTASITRASVNRPDEDLVKSLQYHIFDAIPTSEFNSDSFSESFRDRWDRLETIFKDSSFKYLKLVPHVLMTTHEEVKEFYEKCLKDGYEGIVVKLPNSKYTLDRSKDWLKFKPEETIDGIIAGYTDGTGNITNIFLEPTNKMTDELDHVYGTVARTTLSAVKAVAALWDTQTGGELKFSARLADKLQQGELIALPNGKTIRKFKGAGAIITTYKNSRLDCSGITHAVKLLLPLFMEDLIGLTLEMKCQEEHSGKEAISSFARYKRIRSDK